jgi:outer membrane protein assembly factor BamB
MSHPSSLLLLLLLGCLGSAACVDYGLDAIDAEKARPARDTGAPDDDDSDLQPEPDTGDLQDDDSATPNQAPTLTVEAPICGTVAEDQRLAMTATVVDDSPPRDLMVRWESDRDGLLHEGAPDGGGQQMMETTLSPGEHSITVSVEDAEGAITGSTHPISVVGYAGTYTPQGPDGLSFDGDGYLWVADWDTDRVYRVNPTTSGILWEFDLPYEGADGLTLMGDEILVSFYYTNQVAVLDACTGAELDSWPSPTPGGISDVSWDGSDLWVTDYLEQRIHRVDPGTGRALESFTAPYPYSNGLCFDGSHFWLTANVESDRIARLDSGFQVLEEYAHRGDDPRGIAFDGEWIWWSDGLGGLIDTLVRP